ncbi:MAG TPA: hypothetical protein VN678_03550 [Acidobacteriaceae bacterium]|nr:hypothetical protein [Acidobacteriaceae bacterium]
MIVLFIAGMSSPFSLYAQTAAVSPAEVGHPGYVVSVVKASAPDRPKRSIHFLPGGRFSATGVNVRLLIKIAYNGRGVTTRGIP